MICADTSSIVALLKNEKGPDVTLVRAALLDGTLVVAPISVAELLSDPGFASVFEQIILDIPRLEIKPGYWERSGKLRARMFQQHYRPKLADALIAQSCLDHDVPLITRDRDFSTFQKVAGLRVAPHVPRIQ